MQLRRYTNRGLQCKHKQHCYKLSSSTVRAAPTRQYTLSSVDTSARGEDLPLTADGNYTYLCTNMGETVRTAVSGYAGKWSRFEGPSLDKPLAEGDIIYGFKPKDGQPGITQVWKAEEGDLNCPKLQAQRDTLPQLQKDPLQLQLDMDTLVVEVGAQIPLVDPSFASVPDDKLAATMKTLAVPEHGNLVVTGALPVITGGKGQQQEFFGQPEASTSWFNRLYLRMPGPEPGSSSRWSVMVHYDTTSGDLLTHYHTWEAGIHPEPQALQDVFSPGAHKQLLADEDRRHKSIRHPSSSEECLSNIKPHANYKCSVLQYSGDGSDCTYSSYSNSQGSSKEALLSGGPNAVEVWYDSNCYFKVPASLNPEAVGDKDVIVEVGALIPAPKGSRRRAESHSASVDGSVGLVRWLVRYSGQSRHLKWARNELFTL